MFMPAALADPALRKFDLKRHKLPTADGLVSILCVRDVDALVRRISRAQYERDGHLPYWGDVWPVAVAILRAQVRGPSLLGKRVLDLGCGVGTAGVGAGRRGAHVVFADLDSRALPFAAFNAQHNGCRSFETRQFDWCSGRFEQRFDRILCSDVVYEARHHAPILRQIEQHLLPGGEVWVGDQYRTAADPFFELARARHRVEQEDLEVHFENVRRRVRIVRLFQLAAPPAQLPTPESNA
jgi:2-polyprenyl-3-methyl-5-hydroxy-6-metoxy-1,4-benzoquinol methylase